MAQSLEKQIRHRAKKLKAIAKHEVPKASAKALNDTVKGMRTQVVRETAQSTKIQAKHIRKKVFLSRATPAKQRSKLNVYTQPVKVVLLLRPTALQKHYGRGTNTKGVLAAGQQFDGAFITVHRRSGYFQVYSRVGAKRTPLKVVAREIQDEAEQAFRRHGGKSIQETLRKKLMHELQYRLNKYARK